MLTEYAVLKVQSTKGEEYFIHSLPALLCSKRARESRSTTKHAQLEMLPISNLSLNVPYHALVYYSEGDFHVHAITPLLLNNTQLVADKKL